MFQSFDDNPIQIVGISIILSAVLLVISSNPYVIAAAIFFSVIVYVYGKKALLSLTIISYLANQTEYFGELRVIFNLFTTAVLVYLFLKTFGLEFKKYPRIPNLIKVFIVLLFIALFISTAFSTSPFQSVTAVFRLMLFFGVVYIYYALIDGLQTIFLYFYSLILSAFIISMRLFYDFFNLGFEKFYLRSILEDGIVLSGSLMYTNFTVFFITTLLIAAFLLINEKKNIKFFLILIFSYSVFIIIIANSRAAIIAAILGTVILLSVFKTRLLFNSIFIFSLIFISLYLYYPGFQTLFDFYLRLHTIDERDKFWNAGYEIISSNPIVGTGPETFSNYFFSYAPSYVFDLLDSKIWSSKPTPHSTFLLHWSENGILGLISIIFLYFSFFFIAIKSIISSKKDYKYYVISTTIAGIGLGVLFRAFFEVTGTLQYGFITTDLPFWLLFGVEIYIYQKYQQHNFKSLKLSN